MRRGFTLIELLIVVIIIAILAAVGVPQFFQAAGKAQENRAKSNLGEIRKVELAYQSVNGAWDAFAATTTVSLTADLDNDGNIDIQIGFTDPNYNYSVAGGIATATAIPTNLGGPYTVNLSTGLTNW